MTKKIKSDNIKQILIRSTNWVGDAIITTPAIRAVRKNFSAAEITVLAKPWVAPVFHNNPDIDHLMIYDAAARHGKGVGKLRLSKNLRKRRFDLAILLQNAFEAAFLAFLAGIPNRVGYNTDGRRIFLTHAIALKPALEAAHQIDYYLKMLADAGLKNHGRQLTLILKDEERSQAEKILKQYKISSHDPIIGINPGAKFGTAKRWLPERYAALCNKLQKACRAQILIFGGPGEEGLGNQISASIEKPCINLCGRTRLREAMALIEKCRLFITNDSGLMHVAAALDIAQIAIFGPTDHIATGPSNPNSHIVKWPAECSPCLKPECPTDHRCMREITVDTVFAVAEKLLS
ncbi:MAG: lipopolysaccharide heptosyltransferase II [Desulfobacterales bacterium]|nr:lipopolysaccharide heptosyltransferase II [Desulfobacterales bacterium]